MKKQPSDVYCESCDMRQEAPYFEHMPKCPKQPKRFRSSPQERVKANQYKVDPNSVMQRTLALLKENGSMRPRDMWEMLGESKVSISSNLSHLKIIGQVDNPKRGIWIYIGGE